MQQRMSVIGSEIMARDGGVANCRSNLQARQLERKEGDVSPSPTLVIDGDEGRNEPTNQRAASDCEPKNALLVSASRHPLTERLRPQ